MKDQGDHGRTDAIENGAHRGETAEMDVQGAQGRHDDEVGQDEGPTAGPCSPEPSPQVRNIDPYLDGERPWQRLAHGNAVAEFIFRQPLSLCDQFFFHLSAKSNGSAKTERSKAEVI